jgi:hypothetical protein
VQARKFHLQRGFRSAMATNTLLIIREWNEKISCVNNTGKTIFIGFSVHNEGTIGIAAAER